MSTSPHTAYQTWVKDYLEYTWSCDPVGASRQGIRSGLDQLGVFNRERIDDEMKQSQRFLESLETIHPGTLPLDDQLDYAFLRDILRLSRRYPVVDRSGPSTGPFVGALYTHPAFYLRKLSDGWFTLLMDSHLSPADRRMALLGRLEAAETFLVDARRTLTANAAPELVSIGRMALRGTLHLLNEAVAPLESDDARWNRAVERARRALTMFDGFLQDLLGRASGSFALGRETFEFLLSTYHGCPLTADELSEFGHQEVERYTKELQSLASEVETGLDWVEALEKVKHDHPTPGGLLPAYQKEIHRIRQFLEEQDLVEIPASAAATCAWTPRFLWDTAHLGMPWHPPMFGPGTAVTLFVTPVPPEGDPWEQQLHLRDNSWAWIRCIVPHEIFPGHYMQYLVIKEQLSDVRKSFGSRFTSEGWAMYWEAYLREIGYLDTPSLGLMQVRNALWRAVRIVVDVGLHTGSMTPDQAAEYLHQTARLELPLARAQIRNYMSDPTGPSGYLVGKRNVVALKRELRERQGSAFSDKAFHQAFLAQGTLPMPLVRRGILEQWGLFDESTG